jgi:hypothetical protein
MTSPCTRRYSNDASGGDVTSELKLEEKPGDDNKLGASWLTIIC